MNMIMVKGHTGIPYEFRTTTTGKELVKFTIATNRKYEVDDVVKEFTEWHNVECWNAQIIALLKERGFVGQRLFIQGRMQTDKWEKDGVKHYFAKIVARSIDILTWSKREVENPEPPPEEELPF